ncbi:hypothetical protein GJ744_009150 [Endocarpon pusillum]|uniref:Uncharacterized protein n=1 Tax=Endocarpon pusillum TaxID=364733 RepID=A0A8H7E6G6_9EURO|nr:hypothetical protein GJ744_009150 [Endocarpon pusillum]
MRATSPDAITQFNDPNSHVDVMVAAMSFATGLNAELQEIWREQVIVKRSKRTFSHDVEEFRLCCSSIEEAYSKMVVSKTYRFSKGGQVRQSQEDRKSTTKERAGDVWMQTSKL